jgi:hypothetical protein
MIKTGLNRCHAKVEKALIHRLRTFFHQQSSHHAKSWRAVN